jgi:hypothetical protein
MSVFRGRWRDLARLARRAPEAPLPPVREEWLKRALAARESRRNRAEAVASVPVPLPRPAFALSLLAVAFLYAMALPASMRAWQAGAGLRFSLREIPRPPALPPLRLPSPPTVPSPPSWPQGMERLRALMPEEIGQ